MQIGHMYNYFSANIEKRLWSQIYNMGHEDAKTRRNTKKISLRAPHAYGLTGLCLRVLMAKINVSYI